MPKLKSHRRSEAARSRIQAVVGGRVGTRDVSCDFVPQRGSGFRHKVNEWPVSEITNKFHKLVIPDKPPRADFVLLIGDSHLRSFADGIVPVSDKHLDFGIMCTPGASAAQLRREVLHAVVPREPDAVCVMAPSNNLTTSVEPEEAGHEFEKYLIAVCSQWPKSKIFCTGMVPRLTEPSDKQTLFQHEFHRRSSKLGIPCYSISDKLPLSHLDLWCRDGVSTSSFDILHYYISM
ncbi:uncharacterized protein LOC119420431 [Nematolebias whitei]|uniref:uncharacterized protein LOC119420431 n=1 Tax=Nematolebias whitei TaxID=451745 RepID=UPI00189B62D5|nr:uncharacterized protein LOC119420431 [Nematolebias whitei]